MPSLNIRDVDDDLIRRIRVAVAESGLSLRGWILTVIENSLSQVRNPQKAILSKEYSGVPVVSKGEPKPLPDLPNDGAVFDLPQVPTSPDFTAGTSLAGRITDPLLEDDETAELSDREHVPKDCRVYACGRCKAAGHKAANRGL